MRAIYKHNKATGSLSRPRNRKDKQIGEKKTRREGKKFIVTEA